MFVHFNCPVCGKLYQLTAEQMREQAGQTIACANCNEEFTLASEITPSPAIPALPPQPPPLKSNGFALAAVIFGSLSFCLPIVGGGLAILFGVLGLKKVRPGIVSGKASAIVGIVLGSVSVLLTPCMISILIPSFYRAYETANRVKCARNMQSIGSALRVYANQSGGAYPPRLEDLLLAQLIDSDALICPSSGDTPASGNSSTQKVQNLSTGGHLSYVYVAPSLNSGNLLNAVLLYEPLTNHNRDGCNVLFADGHVEFFSGSTAQQMISQLQSGMNPPPIFRQQ